MPLLLVHKMAQQGPQSVKWQEVMSSTRRRSLLSFLAFAASRISEILQSE
jgi:hypothetical protein